MLPLRGVEFSGTKRKQAGNRGQAAEAESPTTSPKTGLDLVVAWSIVGTFVILASAAIYMMESFLMPITFAIVVGMVLGLAGRPAVKIRLPPALGGLFLGHDVRHRSFFRDQRLVEPLTSLAGQAPGILERAIERVLPYIERFKWVKIAIREHG